MESFEALHALRRGTVKLRPLVPRYRPTRASVHETQRAIVEAMDVLGNREARIWVSMVKAMVPERVCQIIDQAIQIHGATGISQWTPLADMYINQRHLRFADGPDEVHHMVVGRAELSRH